MENKSSKFKTNLSQNTERVMVQCRTMVDKKAVSRTSIDGVEHVIVSSATLPDDVVMNGGLYPAEEIEKSFESLELTLAPVEHPQIDGEFISANDPRAIHDFHAGAWNMNVRRKDGRVWVDKFINVAEARKTDRGKRLLDRINELETSDAPRPIHTSVGVFLLPEQLDKPQTNSAGDEFTWVARDMMFDHDAILLDSVGAAQPHQGVGVAVNKSGEKCRVEQFDIDAAPAVIDGLSESDKLKIQVSIDQSLKQLRDNAEGVSFNETYESVYEALKTTQMMGEADWLSIVDIFPQDSTVIFQFNENLFTVPFVMDDEGRTTIVDIPLRVERNVTYTPKTNQLAGDAMQDLILNALKDAGIATDGLSDAELLDAFKNLHASQSESDSSGAGDDNGLADVVANAVAAATKPLADKLESVEAKLNSAQDEELDRLADLIGNSDKFPALDAEAAKKLGVDTLKNMAANCASAFGVSPLINAGSDSKNTVPADMPE